MRRLTDAPVDRRVNEHRTAAMQTKTIAEVGPGEIHAANSAAESTAKGAAADAFPPSGLVFQTAKSLDDVVAAWRVLHDAYVRVGFITANPFGIHTVPQAVGPHSLVMVGQIQGLTVSTITAIGDNPLGVPVESVYPDEIAQLRSQGRKVLEVGLFG